MLTLMADPGFQAVKPYVISKRHMSFPDFPKIPEIIPLPENIPESIQISRILGNFGKSGNTGACIQHARKPRYSINDDIFYNACLLLYPHHRIEKRVCQIHTFPPIFASPRGVNFRNSVGKGVWNLCLYYLLYHTHWSFYISSRGSFSAKTYSAQILSREWPITFRFIPYSGQSRINL